MPDEPRAGLERAVAGGSLGTSSGWRRPGPVGGFLAFFDPLLGRRALVDPLRVLPPGSVAPARPGEAGARTAVRPTERGGSLDGAAGRARPGAGPPGSRLTGAAPDT